MVFTLGIMAQAPGRISYQALVRDSNNKLIPDANIGMQISILQGTASGTAVFVERHFPSTNSNGLVTVEIGSGTLVSGDILGIDWTNGPYFIKAETDVKGGANYTITGTSQLLSVPYALYAKTAEHADNAIITGDEQAFNGWDKNASDDFSGDYGDLTGKPSSFDDADASPTNELQSLSISGKTLSISDKNSITLPSGLSKTTILNVSCKSVSSIGATYKKISDIGTFSKSSASSTIEAVFSGRIAVTGSFVGSNGATFELRIDGGESTVGRARASVKSTEVGGSGVPVTMIGIFNELSQGNHTVSIWVKTTYGSVTEAMVDPGCWSSDVVVVKEY